MVLNVRFSNGFNCVAARSLARSLARYAPGPKTFLHPEEVLYLSETERLVVVAGGQSLSTCTHDVFARREARLR